MKHLNIRGKGSVYGIEVLLLSGFLEIASWPLWICGLILQDFSYVVSANSNSQGNFHSEFFTQGTSKTMFRNSPLSELMSFTPV